MLDLPDKPTPIITTSKGSPEEFMAEDVQVEWPLW
jgi:hypothetical protein